jgi:predicted SAM-dependent methyltransferase
LLIKALRVAPTSALQIQWTNGLIAHDLRKELPCDDGTASAIYASHLLEHLYLTDAEALLRECFRVLEPGGIARFVVPDLESMVGDYVQSKQSSSTNESPADRLNHRLRLRSPTPPGGFLPYRIYTALKDFHSHKWMYDAESLSSRLRTVGFVDVASMFFRESRILDIDRLELHSRVLNGEGICVEGVKPSGASTS